MTVGWWVTREGWFSRSWRDCNPVQTQIVKRKNGTRISTVKRPNGNSGKAGLVFVVVSKSIQLFE